ncbi:MAG: hypothetical protein M3R24_29075 [Chloroflexota bacterium]|nr:hypothetical protein [Chloroflexota bacterium]
MDHTQLWHDITNAIHDAVQRGLDHLTEERLIARSDAFLVLVPGISGAQLLTTAAFLRHYHMPLHAELCRGAQPYSSPATVAGQLHDLTRAVLVTGAAEGLSIEAAVGIALVLHTRGLAQFCALPVTAV